MDPNYTFPDPPALVFNDEVRAGLLDMRTDNQGYASAYSSDSDEHAEREARSKTSLGRLARRRLEAMLRSMTGKRVEIARAMEFAIKRADVSDEVGFFPRRMLIAM